MNHNNLRPNPKAIQKKKRVGRGTSSGHGKTACRGHKGQTSRSGGTKGLRFEGGQTPLYRRLPKKRGFKNYYFRILYREMNLNDLKKFSGEVKIEDLVKSKYLDEGEKIKILGSGELDKPITVHAHKFTAGAKEKIEKAGGKIVQC
ncbi:MAG: 50S ribosomal protein L15 [Candidatus Margulisiibacteriota bacterium]